MATATDPGPRVEQAGERFASTHDESKWAPLTTEFWAMTILIIAVLIAAAVSDTLGDRRAWTLATIIGAAYIVSRGLAKAGTGHMPLRRAGRR
jgi:cytochrome b